MITFRTQFPLCQGCNSLRLLDVGKIWITGSPHTSLKSDVKKIDLSINDEMFVDSGNESIEFSSYSDESIEVSGIKYTNSSDESLKWTTEVVGAKVDDQFWVSVILDVATELPVGKIPFGKKPYIIRNIVENMGGGRDGELSVSDEPLHLDDSQTDFIADIINGDSLILMPLVYISSCDNNTPYVNPLKLSKWLSGMAHVVVEPNRNFSFQLMEKVSGDNAYGGAVAIYWPNGESKWLFMPQVYPPLGMELAVSNKIRQSLLTQETRNECTWSFLQDLRSKKKIEDLKKSGSKEIEDYISIFDSDIKSKNEEIQRLKSEIDRLKYSTSFLGTDVQTHCESNVSFCTKEKELYQDEIKDILISLLEDNFKNNISPNTRKFHIIEDILENNSCSGLRAQFVDEIKSLLNNYQRMDSATKSGLKRLGFEIISESKHYKLVFKGDDRYTLILSKTASDHRTGKNSVTKIKRLLF